VEFTQDQLADLYIQWLHIFVWLLPLKWKIKITHQVAATYINHWLLAHGVLSMLKYCSIGCLKLPLVAFSTWYLIRYSVEWLIPKLLSSSFQHQTSMLLSARSTNYVISCNHGWNRKRDKKASHCVFLFISVFHKKIEHMFQVQRLNTCGE
jgi:hypothetical protein